MAEDENTIVAPPVQAATEAPTPEASQDNVQVQNQESVQDAPDQSKKGWISKLRREREEDRRKIQMQEELIKQLMTSQQSVQQAPPQEDILQKLQNQEYVPGADVAKALQMQREEFQRELQEIKKANQQQQVQTRFQEIKREFVDFDDVVNPETLALLEETDPRLANVIAKNSDPYDAGLLAYETIKAKGLMDQVPNARRAKEVEKKLEQNKKTVQSPQAYSQRPMAQAFKMPETKQEKQALWQETLKYASMGGGGY